MASASARPALMPAKDIAKVLNRLAISFGLLKMNRLNAQQLKTIQRMLRVDQAGEIGANYIYKGQLQVLGESDDTIQHMYQQEKRHLAVLDEMIPIVGYGIEVLQSELISFILVLLLAAE